MAISQYARALLRTLEGRRLKAYPDPATGGDPWTNGYGHTKGVKQGDVCDDAQAEAWLTEDITAAESVIIKWVTVPLTQGMRDALVLFIFNIGPGVEGHKDGFVWLKSGGHSTMIRKLNARDYEGAAAEFPKWDRAAGKVMASLHSRRLQEQALFTSQGLFLSTPQGATEPGQDATITPEPTQPPTPTPSEPPMPPTQYIPAGEVGPTEASAPAGPVSPGFVDAAGKVASVASLFMPGAFGAIAGVVPSLIQLFGGNTAISNRNAAAAQMVVDVVKSAIKAPNEQAVIEKIQSDPTVIPVIQQAVQDNFMSIHQALEQAKAAQREFVMAYSKDKDVRTVLWNMTYIEILALFFVAISAGGALGVLFSKEVDFSPELKGAIVTLMLIGGWTGIKEFFFGGSRSSDTKTDLIAHQQKPPAN